MSIFSTIFYEFPIFLYFRINFFWSSIFILWILNWVTYQIVVYFTLILLLDLVFYLVFFNRRYIVFLYYLRFLLFYLLITLPVGLTRCFPRGVRMFFILMGPNHRARTPGSWGRTLCRSGTNFLPFQIVSRPQGFPLFSILHRHYCELLYYGLLKSFICGGSSYFFSSGEL